MYTSLIRIDEINVWSILMKVIILMEPFKKYVTQKIKNFDTSPISHSVIFFNYKLWAENEPTLDANFRSPTNIFL